MISQRPSPHECHCGHPDVWPGGREAGTPFNDQIRMVESWRRSSDRSSPTETPVVHRVGVAHLEHQLGPRSAPSCPTGRPEVHPGLPPMVRKPWSLSRGFCWSSSRQEARFGRGSISGVADPLQQRGVKRTARVGGLARIRGQVGREPGRHAGPTHQRRSQAGPPAPGTGGPPRARGAASAPRRTAWPASRPPRTSPSVSSTNWSRTRSSGQPVPARSDFLASIGEREYSTAGVDSGVGPLSRRHADGLTREVKDDEIAGLWPWGAFSQSRNAQFRFFRGREDVGLGSSRASRGPGYRSRRIRSWWSSSQPADAEPSKDPQGIVGGRLRCPGSRGRRNRRSR